MSISDAVKTIKDLLSTNWNSVNTDNITPIIDYSENKKRLDIRDSALLVYERAITDKKMGLGWTRVNRSYNIVIDIYTTRGRTHFTKLLAEMERILNENAVNPPNNYNFLDPDGALTIPQNYPHFNHGVKEITLIKYTDGRD